MGMHDPTAHAENKRYKMNIAQQALDVKLYEKKQLLERMAELQDILTATEKEAEELQVIATKAQEEYETALRRVADQTHREKCKSRSASVPDKGAEQYMGWLRALKNGKPTEATQSDSPDIQQLLGSRECRQQL